MKKVPVLERIARQLHAPRCPLGRRGSRPVPGEGPADARIFFVGQAPGAEENRTGRPFVGRAGRFLDQALRDVGLSRDTIFITSVEKYFPPGNRPPTREEIAACKPVLLRQIEAIDPEVVVSLGRVAEAALRGEPVLRGRRVFSTVHPAVAMRFPRMRRRFLRDLRTLTRLLSSCATIKGRPRTDDPDETR
jgi:DNA polymerase